MTEQPPSFEQSMQELESIVNQLEQGGSMNLDNTLALFERGVQLTKQCQQTLDHAKQHVVKVMESNGSLLEETMVSPESDMDEVDDIAH